MSQFNYKPIAELEPQTKARLRSTQLLTSLPQLISELVQNSLDAGASHIQVGIDPTQWECWVRDDGQGMSTEGMKLLAGGHEKGRYISSKTYEASHTEAGTFGFRGEALASAMELSCLEISSRTPGARESWSVILKAGEQLYFGPSVRWRREKTGTTVVCRDVFFNVPVRRISHPNVTRTLELTRKELESLALVFPQVSFTLDHTSESQKVRVISIPKTSSSLTAFRALYGKSMAENVEELNVRSEDLTIEGFISLSGSHSRGYQNFYVNRHPMVLGDIQRAIEQKFVTSGFGRLAQDGTERSLHSTSQYPSKKVDRRPVYVLNLSVSTTQVDNFIEPAKSMDTSRVLSFILEVIHRFLSRNGFGTTVSEDEETEATHTKELRPLRKRVRYENLEPGPSEAPATFILSESDRRLTCSDIEHLEPRSTHQIGAQDVPTQHRDSGYFEWDDPSTGESFLINSQTGNSLPKYRTFDHTLVNRPAAIVATSNDPGVHGSPTAFPVWLANALKVGSIEFVATASHAFLSAMTPSLVQKQNSEVIAQVDAKFIACIFRVTSTSERILVLVDQHAADERLKPPVKILLTRKEANILTRPDTLNALSRWGLCIEIHLPDTLDVQTLAEDRDFCQVDVISVPDVVSKKLVDERELSVFVKAMLDTIDVEGCTHWPFPSANVENDDWVKALRFCPAPLFELLNSRACRGAIMFNDPLDEYQCQHLIMQLGRTIFPFQCAHGRPSIAPLLRVDTVSSTNPATDWKAFDQELYNVPLDNVTHTSSSAPKSQDAAGSLYKLDVTIVIYKPDTQSTEEYMIVVDPDERSMFSTPPLAILEWGKASKQQLEGTFGTSKEDDVVGQILNKGVSKTGSGFASKTGNKNDKNLSQRGKLWHARSVIEFFNDLQVGGDKYAPETGGFHSTSLEGYSQQARGAHTDGEKFLRPSAHTDIRIRKRAVAPTAFSRYNYSRTAYQRPLGKPPDDLLDENGNPLQEHQGSLNNVAVKEVNGDAQYPSKASTSGTEQPLTLSGTGSQQDHPDLIPQFIALDSRELHTEKAWDLWNKIISNELAAQVPIYFIIHFVDTCADNTLNSTRHPARGSSPQDPWIARIGSVLNYLSTSYRPLGGSEQVELGLVRIKHALLSNEGSLEVARAELENLWRLKSLDSPIFLGAIFHAIRNIVQAQPNLSNTIDLLIDYWDAIHPALVGFARYTDQTPRAPQEALLLQEAVYTLFSHEVWPSVWVYDRFSKFERSRAERLALLFLAFAAQRRLALEVGNAYALVSQTGIPVSYRLLQLVIRILIKDGQFALAMTALDADALNAAGRKSHYRLRMRLAAAMGDSKTAAEIYELMTKLQYMDQIDQELLLQTEAIQGNAERAVTLFDELFRPSIGKSTSKPNKYHYSTVIAAHARNGSEKGASEWLKRMAKAGIPPDLAVYNSILHIFALKNDVTSVVGVLKRMKKSGIERDIRTVTILVSMYARRRDPMGAEQVIRHALTIPGFIPDRKLLNSLLSAHINGASWLGVIRVFDWMVSMKSSDFRPEIDTMNNVLKAYVHMGAPLSTVVHAFSKLKSFGLRPNSRSYLMLIQSACDAGMDVAWRAFNELEATATKQFNPINAYILTLLMGGYLRKGDKIQARTIYEEMQARGIHPTAVSFRVILSAYANERTEESLEAAERFMGSLLESSPHQGEGWRKATTGDSDPIMTVFTPLLVAHGRSLHPSNVEAKFRQMLDLGAEPTVESFTLLMDAYRLKDHHAQIESTQKFGESDTMTSRRSNVLCIGLSVYIDALSQAGRHREIALTWQKARKDGFAFDAHNWNHLSIALVRAGEPERAFEVVERVLIPYSQFTDRAIKTRNREAPSLLTEGPDIPSSANESQTTLVKPRERPRVMRSLTKRGVAELLEEEADPTDMVYSLHILHQMSPTQNLWVPHQRTLVEIAMAAQRLKRGLMVTPRASHGQGTPSNDVRSTKPTPF
ncbi:MutL C terminal dimerization domain [Rhizoctonia solani]|uniref:MutL C terminal dimerization domain n=1 Tax=Rhizoctonia solani TaxID=456999 RepID=A0A8H7M849_9AGAM|nr:MutL C terminal dimerization domain [Rhizoctonia solani]